MKMVIAKNNRTILNTAFACWLISEILFEYSIISQTMLLLFTGLSIVVVPKIRWPYVLSGYAMFVILSVLNIVTHHATNQTVATDMTRTVTFCLIFLYGFSCYYHYIGDLNVILKIYKWVIAAFSAMCLMGGFVSVLSGERLSTFGINANLIAMQAGYALIVTANELLNKHQNQKPTVWLLLIALFVLTILLTGSRKGLIIPVLGVYILVAFRRSGRFFAYTLAAAIAICIMLWLMLNMPVLYRVVGYRIEPVLHYLQGTQIQEASMETRLQFISLAWSESKKAPIWGHGLDCFRMQRYAYGVYSHCNYMEILYSLGWPGLISYYIPYLCVFGKVPKIMRRNRSLAVLVLAFLAPYVICDYMNITYFTRAMLIIPAIAMFSVSAKEISYVAEQST